MKRFLTLMLVLFSVAMLQAEERVINLPAFSGWNSQTIEIQKIVLSDTAAVLHIDAFYEPGWWIKIVSDTYLLDSNGNKYTIRYADGFPLDEEYTMPPSGTSSFRLIFPPLPKGLKEVSFVEGDGQGAFEIWGIRLDGRPFTSAMTDKKMAPKETPVLETPVFAPGIATLNGKVAGYSPAMKLSGKVYVNNALMGSQDEYTIDVQPNGTFSVEIPLQHISSVGISTPFFNHPVYLKPGEKTYLEINLPEVIRSQSRLHSGSPSLGEKYIFEGALAAFNYEAMNHPLKYLPVSPDTREAYDQMFTDISTMEGEQLLGYWTERYTNALKELDKYPETSPAYRELLILNAKLSAAEMLVSGRGMVQYAYKKANGLDPNAELPEAVKPVFKHDYYYSLKEYIPNDGKVLYYRGVGYLLDNLSHYGKPDGFLSDVPTFSEIMGTDKGFLFDFIAAKKLAGIIAEFTPLTDEQLAEAGNISPVIRDVLTAENNSLKEKLEANKQKTGYNINVVDTKDIPNEDIFSAIVAPYLGKVVFVDFWATWCGPCIQAFKLADEVKKEMEDKDVVFLYLAGENSPEGKWENMIPDIKGDHYRVTNAQWDYMSKYFGIQGIPTYMVIQKDGTITNKRAGFPGASWMREKLTEALEKDI